MSPFTILVTVLTLGLASAQNETQSARDKVLQDDAEEVGRRIVGGTRVAEGQLSYQVGLTAGDRRAVFCGGSVIGSHWIVTAAHCLTDGSSNHFPTTLLRAVAGTTNHFTRGAEILPISRIIVHEGYNANTHVNDIALLRTRNSITRGRAISLPASGTSPSGTGLVSGWGTKSEGGQRSYDLLAANIDVLRDAYCYRTYGSQYRAPEMLCAGVLAGGKDTCQGDSGGPLAQSGTLVGITSFGRGCARANTPGVYTRVSNYVDWIQCHTATRQQQSTARRCAAAPSGRQSSAATLSPLNLIPFLG